MAEYSEVFAAFDVAKRKRGVAIPDQPSFTARRQPCAASIAYPRTKQSHSHVRVLDRKTKS